MTDEFKAENQFRLNENLPRIKKCLSLLTEEQVWFSPNKNTNSVGNLILHLAGNIRQYGITGLSKKTDNRNRNEEFSANGTRTKQELFDLISSTISEACTILTKMSLEQLKEMYSIQGFELNGVSVAVHITEHLSYHVGQIALLTKLITNQDLEFYADLDLSITS